MNRLAESEFVLQSKIMHVRAKHSNHLHSGKYQMECIYISDFILELNLPFRD